MDRLIYVGMTAAKHTMAQLNSTSQNLSNLKTTGFKADIHMFSAIPAYGPGNPTREYVVNSTVGSDFSPGMITQTGNPLDLAISGPGWFTVKLPDGNEAYTRAGGFKLDSNGVLRTSSGLPVVGASGAPITIPPNTEVTVGRDGTITTVPSQMTLPYAVSIIGQLKLVNPPESNLVKGADNLFRTKNGVPADPAANVNVLSGSLESSNVDMINCMLNMIDLGRDFDMQMKLLQTADSDASHASVLLNINA